MFGRVGRYIIDTVTRFSIENLAVLVLGMIIGWGGFTWLSSQWSALAEHGWAAVALFALGVTCVAVLVLSAFLIAWRYFKPLPRHDALIDPELIAPDPAHDISDPETYYRLIDFSWKHLMPACEAQISLQKQIIRVVANDKIILAQYAIVGLEHYSKTEEFWDCHNNIRLGIETSEPMLRYDALVNIIKSLEKRAYKGFCEHAQALAPGYDYRTDPHLAKLWEDWRIKHNALVTAFDTEIKCDPRFGRKLFLPTKESRWGGIIPPLQLEPLKPEGTPT